MKKIKGIIAIVVAATTFLMAGCDKTQEYTTILPPVQAHFMNKTEVTYQILTANSSFKIPVGVTQTANVDRKVTINVTSTSGALSGTEYTITNNVVIIPAGKAVDSIEIKGVLSRFLNDERDTLIFTIVQPEITPSEYNDKLRVILRGPCFEGNVNLTSLRGNYRAIETFGTGAPYGPYNTTISAITNTSATTGTITVTNIWNNGWGPMQFNLDWTDPNNRTVTVVPQNAIPGSNAGDLSATYAGQTIAARPFSPVTAANSGTFSACNSTFTLRMQLGVTNVGYFSNIYTVNLTR